MSEATRIEKPIPEPDEASAPFFDGAARGVLMIMRCEGCGTYLAPGTRFCSECLGEDLTWTEASGRGELFTFGIMHQRYHPGFDAEIPYNIAVVELEEGPRVNTNVVGCSNDELVVGMKLQAVFEKVADGVHLPKFRPA